MQFFSRLTSKCNRELLGMGWGHNGMKSEPVAMRFVGGFAVCLLAAAVAITPAKAQQVTGVLGSASATTTLEGNQLPPPPPQFGGVISESAKDSKPWWPPRVAPPKGAPNVLL